MVDLLDEVADEVRQERLENMAKKYGPYVIGTILTVLAITGVYIAWQNHVSSQIKELSTAYYAASTLQKESKEQLAAFEKISKEATSTYGLLSRFQEAQIQQKLGNSSKALDLFNELTAISSSNSDALKHTATMLKILTAIDGLQDPKNTKAADELIEELETLQNQAPAWAYLAKLLQAQLYIATGKKEQGQGLLKLLSSAPGVPQNVADLAKAYLSAYTSGTAS